MTHVATEIDHVLMEKAFALAERGHPHHTFPNPVVGALIAHDDEVVGTGYHRESGQGHAEAIAIEEAGERCGGGVLYSTLEPCAYEGAGKRTPPCVKRVIDAGISRVVIGAIDPNERENGRGIAALQGHDIPVTHMNMQARFTQQNEGYVVRMRHQRPLVELKLAQTVDGYSADSVHDSQWISDEGARHFAHHLRACHDAILVGTNTARHDNPRLSARFGLDHHPTRVVIDRDLTLPPSLHLFETASKTPTYVVHDAKTNGEERGARLDARGVHRIALDMRADDFCAQLASHLCTQTICNSVLVEGGAQTIGRMMEAGVWDRISLIISPTLLMNGDHIRSQTVRTMANLVELDAANWYPLTDFDSRCMALRGYRDCADSFGIPSAVYHGNWHV